MVKSQCHDKELFQNRLQEFDPLQKLHDSQHPRVGGGYCCLYVDLYYYTISNGL